MRHFIRLAVLVLLVSLPLAGGSTASHAATKLALPASTCFFLRTLGPAYCPCTLAQRARTAGRAIGIAVRVTTKVLFRADRGHATPSVPVGP